MPGKVRRPRMNGHPPMGHSRLILLGNPRLILLDDSAIRAGE
jgi:hypothetical protein